MSENRQTGRKALPKYRINPEGVLDMATNRRELPLDAPADKVWTALRDFEQVHTKVAPGFLTGLRMDRGDRMVTFFNGLVARERLVTLDDAEKRLVYTIVDGGASHYNAAVQIVADGPGKCRLVWTIDLLPNEMAPAIAGMMDHATGFMKKTLEA
jgi:carbon monoxide dehydrogenase subunit G